MSILYIVLSYLIYLSYTTTTTTNASATIRGLDMSAARSTPEYQAILQKAAKFGNRANQAADMMYKAEIAKGTIKPPAGGQSATPAPAQTGRQYDFEESLTSMKKLAGLNEFDMDGMMKSLDNVPNVKKTSSFTSNVDGHQDDTETGFNSAMSKFNDIAKGMGISGSGDAPGANIPNPPSADKQDPKEMLKKMPEADIAKLSGDDAKAILGQLKKLAGM